MSEPAAEQPKPGIDSGIKATKDPVQPFQPPKEEGVIIVPPGADLENASDQHKLWNERKIGKTPKRP